MKTQDSETSTISLKPQWLTNQTEIENIPKKKRDERNNGNIFNNNRSKNPHQFYNNVIKNGRNINKRSSQQKLSINNSSEEYTNDNNHYKNNMNGGGPSANGKNLEFMDPPHTSREHSNHSRKMAFQNKNNKSTGNSKSCDSLNNYSIYQNNSNHNNNNNTPIRRNTNNIYYNGKYHHSNHNDNNENGSYSKSPREDKSSYPYYKKTNNHNNGFKKLYNNNNNNNKSPNKNSDDDSLENDNNETKNNNSGNINTHNTSHHSKKEFSSRNNTYHKERSFDYSLSSSSNSSEIHSPIHRKRMYGLTKHISSPDFQNIENTKNHQYNKDGGKERKEISSVDPIKKSPIHSIKFEPPKIHRSGSDSILPFTLSTIPNTDISQSVGNYSSIKGSLSNICENDDDKNNKPNHDPCNESGSAKLDLNEERFLKELGWSPHLIEKDDDDEWSLTEEEILEFKENSNPTHLRQSILKNREQLKSDFENSIKVWLMKNK